MLQASHNDGSTILGIPVMTTVNPVTEQIDYMYSTMDVLSYDAFTFDSVRTTVWNEKFDAFLPLYVSGEHFSRAVKRVLPRCIEELCPHVHHGFRPDMVLDVLPRLMNTMVVLLCDKGVAVCDAALDGFCRIHRLFLACVQLYSDLRATVDDTLKKFARSEAGRSKSRVPSLGNFVPLLTVVEVSAPSIRVTVPVMYRNDCAYDYHAVRVATSVRVSEGCVSFVCL